MLNAIASSPPLVLIILTILRHGLGITAVAALAALLIRGDEGPRIALASIKPCLPNSNGADASGCLHRISH